ncbi:MAG: hypothetical protein V7711_11075 [Pseudomonadales bacterium]
MASDIKRPGVMQSLLEFRAGVEGIALLGSYRVLLKATPGNGDPVLVIPGFTATDNGTFFLRRYLEKIGYDCYGWELGPNQGLSELQFQQLEQRLDDIYQETGRAVSVIGWNLGGLYARALAGRHSHKVKRVISLAAPFALPSLNGVSEALSRLYSHYNSDGDIDALFNNASEFWERSPPVPSSSIYSEGDGVINWRFCLDEPGRQTENIRVMGSHLGLLVNPLVFSVIADRLAEDVEHWRPFAETHRGKFMWSSLLKNQTVSL